MLEDSYKHKGLRKSLVQTLFNKGINDSRVLEAIMRVPRHYFFDQAFLEHAYEDKAFPIGEGQTISQPYTVAFQTTLLDVTPGSKVLEIGTGSGYQSCVLLELGAKVYTIEYNRELYEKARKFLPMAGYFPNFYYGDGSQGLPLRAPFDRIIVTAGAPTIPEALVNQLALNGILIIPVGNRKLQKMVKLTKLEDNKIKKEEFTNFSFVPLLGKNGW